MSNPAQILFIKSAKQGQWNKCYLAI